MTVPTNFSSSSPPTPSPFTRRGGFHLLSVRVCFSAGEPPNSGGDGEPEGGEDEEVDGEADDRSTEAIESAEGLNPGVAEPVTAGGGGDLLSLFQIDGDGAE